MSNTTETSTRQLVGYDNFVRTNPMSDKFEMEAFDHFELYCGDASTTSKRFSWGFGMREVAKSDLSTGNKHYASYALQSGEIKFILTAPYNSSGDKTDSLMPNPTFDTDEANKFIIAHGTAVKAVGIRVKCAVKAFEICVANGGIPITKPIKQLDKASNTYQTFSEVKLQGDVVLRWISGDYSGPALPNYELTDSPEVSIGLLRLDHAVTNVPHLFEAVDYLMGMTGWHQFGEFTAKDVGTVDSGLNSMVLANNSLSVLLPVNEPTHGTKLKSQIQMFLEASNGPGVQHIALLSDDIIATVAQMRQRSALGGFDFMPAPGPQYYERLPARLSIGGSLELTEQQLREIAKLGILADRDEKGVLLQIFTRPLTDRPTLFVEIIQRLGCPIDQAETDAEKEKRENEKKKKEVRQEAACGGFGKGNFGELFKSLEDFERQVEESATKARVERETGSPM